MRADGCGEEIPLRIVGVQHGLKEQEEECSHGKLEAHDKPGCAASPTGTCSHWVTSALGGQPTCTTAMVLGHSIPFSLPAWWCKGRDGGADSQGLGLASKAATQECSWDEVP